MWTNRNRARYDRSKLRYPSDLTDDEWTLVEALIPPGKRGGGKRTVNMREVVNGSHANTFSRSAVSGARFRKDLPPKKLWSMTTSICGPMTAPWKAIYHALYVQCREQAQRGPPVRLPPSSTARA